MSRPISSPTSPSLGHMCIHTRSRTGLALLTIISTDQVVRAPPEWQRAHHTCFRTHKFTKCSTHTRKRRKSRKIKIHIICSRSSCQDHQTKGSVSSHRVLMLVFSLVKNRSVRHPTAWRINQSHPNRNPEVITCDPNENTCDVSYPYPRPDDRRPI